MKTEKITVNKDKYVILHINENDNLVHRVDVHTPNNVPDRSTNHHPHGISKEEAIQEYCSK